MCNSLLFSLPISLSLSLSLSCSSVTSKWKIYYCFLFLFSFFLLRFQKKKQFRDRFFNDPTRSFIHQQYKQYNTIQMPSSNKLFEELISAGSPIRQEPRKCTQRYPIIIKASKWSHTISMPLNRCVWSIKLTENSFKRTYTHNRIIYLLRHYNSTKHNYVTYKNLCNTGTWHENLGQIHLKLKHDSLKISRKNYWARRSEIKFNKTEKKRHQFDVSYLHHLLESERALKLTRTRLPIQNI